MMKRIIYNHQLTTRAIQIYLILLDQDNAELSNIEIGLLAGCTPSTVKRSINQLVDQGFVERTFVPLYRGDHQRNLKINQK